MSGSLALAANAKRRIDVRRATWTAQLETLLLQNRGFSGKITADAKISGSTAARNRRRTPSTRRVQELPTIRSRDLDYRGTRIGIDATLQQSQPSTSHPRGVADSLLRASPGGGSRRRGREEIDAVTSTPIALAVVQGPPIS